MEAEGLKTATGSAAPDYWAAVEGAAYYPQEQCGVLRLRGEDRIDFLQRQTTNNVKRLEPGRVVTTVLTTPAARILDVLQLVIEEETILAITLPGKGEETADHLKRMIFFMDKVSVEEESGEWAVIDLEGPKAGKLLERAGGQSPGREETRAMMLGEAKLSVAGKEGITGAIGYRLLCKQAGEARAALETGGAMQLSQESYETLRIEAGAPGAGWELTEDFTPLEVNLDWTVSDTKGCYTGQEVIARQLTYDKVTQRLVRLMLEEQAAPGSKVMVDGKRVGTVTSTAISPRLGAIGLAVIKRPQHMDGTKVRVAKGEGEISGRVSGIHTR